MWSIKLKRCNNSIDFNTVFDNNIKCVPFPFLLMRWIVWGRFLEAQMKAWDKVRKADPLTQSFTPLFPSDFKNCETFLMWFFYKFMNLYTFLTKVS